jgi:hypothetical protein
MIDISSARVEKLIVHRIGNKLRDEGFKLSQAEAEQTSTLEALLLKNYLAPVIRQGNIYDFHHESDISLNTAYHFAELIFRNKETFRDHSQSIAKHLYSASTHPNIGGGEFIVILFNDIRIENSSEQGLGLFRIEGKSDYLDIADANGSLHVVERLGISLDKIQKGAIALSGGRRLYVIDTLSQKTKYWIDSFLKAVPSDTPKACAKAAGAFLKAVSNRVAASPEAVEFGRELQDNLSKGDNLTFKKIKKISNSYLDKQEVEGILAGIKTKSGLEMTDDLVLDCEQLARYTRDVVTKTRIAEGINLVVTDQHAQVLSVDVKQTRTGLRAVIEIQTKGA